MQEQRLEPHQKKKKKRVIALSLMQIFTLFFPFLQAECDALTRALQVFFLCARVCAAV
jgi:hypothetical protein